MVALLAVNDRPLPLVVADRVAVGVPPATPVMPNCAEVVAVPPTKTSKVLLAGERALLFSCQ